MNCSHATLGKNIRTLRNARGLSQEALAQDAQITQSHLGCIERGRGNPTVETLFSICNALQVDIAELFQDTSAIPSAPPNSHLYKGNLNCCPPINNELFLILYAPLSHGMI